MKNVTKPKLSPMVSLFLKLTAVVAVAIVVLVVAGYLLRIVLIAAIIAAITVGAFFLYNVFKRRSNNYPAIK